MSSPSIHNSRLMIVAHVHFDRGLTSVQAKILGRSPSCLRYLHMINSSRTFACRQITHGTYICSLQVSSHGSHSSNQPRDQLCSALSCPDSAVGCSDPTLGIPSCSKGNKAKTSKSNRESWKWIEIERNALPIPQSQPTHRYRQQNKQ